MKNNKGMTTIEACFIVLISMAIIFLLFGTAVYYYDQVVLSAAVAKSAMRGCEYSYKDNKEIIGIVEEHFKYMTDNQLVMLKDPQINVTVSAFEIKVNAKADFDTAPFNGLRLFKLQDNWKIDVTEYAPRMKASNFVRNIRNIRKMKKDKAEGEIKNGD